MSDVRAMNASDYAVARRAAIKGIPVAPPVASPSEAPPVRIGTSDPTAPPPKPADTAPKLARDMPIAEYAAAKRGYVKGRA